MTPLQPNFIAPFDKGLTKNKKPFALMDQAFSDLQNAYCWREQVKKREGLELVGRLQRNIVSGSIGNSSASVWTFNIFMTVIPNVIEPHAELFPGSVVIVIGAVTLTDNGNGLLTSITPGNFGNINYDTSIVNITTTEPAGTASTISFSYYPSLPVMGILLRDLAAVNQEQTVFFDTKYAYIFSAGLFQEFIPGTTWNGSDSNFFSAANYRGVTPDIRVFFVTNNNATGTPPDPMYYTANGTSWNVFTPLIGNVPQSAAASYLFQARILIPYYGRLVALNTWEGPNANGSGAVNTFARARFSAIGDPTASTPGSANNWRSDMFGLGGFIDAPTNEMIVSATFYKNTLIVGFESSTWQLRYVGEYGLPFIWERISSDFGTESTFSAVLFDDGVFSIGDKAIVQSNGVNVKRLDIDIPDTVFIFQNQSMGTARIQGVRDFKRELVYWSYVDSTDVQINQVFPNRVLVYNYRNQTWAIFRDNVTAFGTLQPSTAITWDSLNIFWDDEIITWDDPDEQTAFPFIVSGNQEGFVHKYGYTTPDEGSLSITAVNLTTAPIQLNINNHNLEDGEIVYLSGLQFLNSSGTVVAPTSLNGLTYQVQFIDINTIGILKFEPVEKVYVNNFAFTPVPTSLYVGGGTVALDPVLYIATKDFNPYQAKGMQMKMSKIDFLMDATPSAAMSVQLWLNSSLSVQGNLLIGNKECDTSLPSPFYVPNSQYAWQSFYATLAGQYVRVIITYDDLLMNTLSTRMQTLVLNAMNLWTRSGGKILY